MSKRLVGSSLTAPALALRIAHICAGAGLAVAAFGAAGWILHLRLLAGQWGMYIPMAPTTALALLLLTGGLLLYSKGHHRYLWIAAAVPAVIAGLELVEYFTGLDAGLDWALTHTRESIGGIPLGQMSPLAALTILTESSAFLLLHRKAAGWAAALAGLGTATGIVIVVGYLYGAPLLYGSPAIPVALPSAVALTLAGISLSIQAFLRSPAAQAWSSDATFAALLRAFLPPILGFLVLEDVLASWIERHANIALVHSLSVLICGLLIVLICIRAARRTGHQLDRAAERVRASEELAELMFQHSASGMALVSPDSHFLKLNGAFCRMLGYTEAELQSMTIPDLMAADAITVSGEQERRYRCKDGSQVWGLVSSQLIRDAQDQPLYFVSQVVDITERKRSEEALRDSEKRLREAESLAHIGSTSLELESGVLSWSEGMFRITGRDPSEAAPDQMERSRLFTPESWARLLEAEWAALGAGAPYDLEVEIVHADGSLRQARAKGSVSRAADGRVVRLFGSMQDITELKQADVEKAKLQAQLAQAQKMESIGQLAGGVAHDFNNLLTVINGYSQVMLERMGKNDPLKPRLEEIQRAGARAAALTKQLLAFSRKQVLQPRRLNLNRVVGDMQPMLERLVGEDVLVQVKLYAEEAMILADPHLLEQVLMNLVINSRDAMPNGGKLLVETRIVADGSAGSGSSAVLVVSDTGEGMDEETKKRIFEPFFTTKGVGKGTGLGLAMVQGTVAQSGGRIEVYSEPGRGTSFKVYLPAELSGEREMQTPALIPVAGGRETILVVEDQEEVRNFAIEVLKLYGYKTLAAGSAQEAMKVCGQVHVDLLLTDVVMPQTGGRELARQVELSCPAIKILYMSGYTDNEIAEHGILEAGAMFIEKPFSPEALARKVREALGPLPAA